MREDGRIGNGNRGRRVPTQGPERGAALHPQILNQNLWHVLLTSEV